VYKKLEGMCNIYMLYMDDLTLFALILNEYILCVFFIVASKVNMVMHVLETVQQTILNEKKNTKSVLTLADII
jgi:hypothetical protein